SHLDRLWTYNAGWLYFSGPALVAMMLVETLYSLNGVDTEEEIYRITYFGKGRMPGFGENCTPRGQCTFGPRLPEEDIKILAEFVKVGWTTHPVNVGWTSPPSGWMKLNTDGSALRNSGRAGARGVLGNELGRWIRRFALFLGATNSLVAELWAIREGLVMIRALDIQSLWVELDAKVVLDLI
ncbi:hypothetical protein CRG98_048481, partial [Punica granatum]